jgi:hypothetical protein
VKLKLSYGAARRRRRRASKGSKEGNELMKKRIISKTYIQDRSIAPAIN